MFCFKSKNKYREDSRGGNPPPSTPNFDSLPYPYPKLG